MSLVVECCSCSHTHPIEDIECDISIDELLDGDSTEKEIHHFADENGIEFDCPHCEDTVYLSECEIF